MKKAFVLLTTASIIVHVLTGCCTRYKASDTEPSAGRPLPHVDTLRTVYRGVVTDSDGNAVRGAKLHILRRPNINTVSGIRGFYELSWLPSSIYDSQEVYIIARCEEDNLASATKLVPGAQTQDITLMPAVTAKGRITDQNHNPITLAQVSFGLVTKDYITSFADRRRFRVDSDGNYRIPFVPPHNRYSIRFHADGYGSKNFFVNSDNAVDQVLELGAVALSKADQTISGLVTDSTGQPVPNAQVFLKNAPQPSGPTLTDAKGAFTITVCEGNVVLSAVIKRDGVLWAGRATAISGSHDISIVLEPQR